MVKTFSLSIETFKMKRNGSRIPLQVWKLPKFFLLFFGCGFFFSVFVWTTSNCQKFAKRSSCATLLPMEISAAVYWLKPLTWGSNLEGVDPASRIISVQEVWKQAKLYGNIQGFAPCKSLEYCSIFVSYFMTPGSHGVVERCWGNRSLWNPITKSITLPQEKKTGRLWALFSSFFVVFKWGYLPWNLTASLHLKIVGRWLSFSFWGRLSFDNYVSTIPWLFFRILV